MERLLAPKSLIYVQITPIHLELTHKGFSTHSLQQEETNLKMGSKIVHINTHLQPSANTWSTEQIPIMLKCQTQELPTKQDYYALNLDMEAFSRLKTKVLKHGKSTNHSQNQDSSMENHSGLQSTTR